MAFARLIYRESLRDIQCCLRAVQDKLYHMGIRGNVSRSILLAQGSDSGCIIITRETTVANHIRTQNSRELPFNALCGHMALPLEVLKAVGIDKAWVNDVKIQKPPIGYKYPAEALLSVSSGTISPWFALEG